jgi:hypothetical protein
MEPQHIRFHINKLHAFQALVRGGASNIGRDKILKCNNNIGGHLSPHRSRVQGINGDSKNESLVKNLEACKNKARA